MDEILKCLEDENIDIQSFDSEEWTVILLTKIAKELQEANKLTRRMVESKVNEIIG